MLGVCNVDYIFHQRFQQFKLVCITKVIECWNKGKNRGKKELFLFFNNTSTGSAFLEDRQKEHSKVLLAIPSHFDLEANVSNWSVKCLLATHVEILLCFSAFIEDVNDHNIKNQRPSLWKSLETVNIQRLAWLLRSITKINH